MKKQQFVTITKVYSSVQLQMYFNTIFTVLTILSIGFFEIPNIRSFYSFKQSFCLINILIDILCCFFLNYYSVEVLENYLLASVNFKCCLGFHVSCSNFGWKLKGNFHCSKWFFSFSILS